ncbi:TylF/MycF/NovP-related O-methyltransferase [Emcibacter sp. SYSU 3D8]|uniref:TylF/MycF/NovP-related O-methyltransferase n=1 Tax=Emcibacter sp. SYSU 3D8 TaxID=3133969 RepID=UPI0031FEB7B0
MKPLETIDTSRLPWVSIAKQLVPPILWGLLYKWLIVRNIPQSELYKPHYSPWLNHEFQELYAHVSNHTLVSVQSCWTLHQLLAQSLNVPGDVIEAGVFKGGTARLLQLGLQPGRRLFLLDSFEGMKHVSDNDRHKAGDFSDTSLESVRSFLGNDPSIRFIKGWIPKTFEKVDSNNFCFAHIDLDLYQITSDLLHFIYPRLVSGGIIVLDDYGYASCPGAREAVDEFFSDKPERILTMTTAQAIIIKV